MKTVYSTVGRPRAEVKFPRGKFTFQELCELNPTLAHLTLRNHMKKDKSLGKKSTLVCLEQKGEPGSQAGYGRKPNLYIRRELLGKDGNQTVRNIPYHVTTAKAPTHSIKRTELPRSRAHTHQVVNVPNGNTPSVTISFNHVPGSPSPTSVTVNFLPKAIETPNEEPIKESTTTTPLTMETPVESNPTPPETATPIASAPVTQEV